jgi:hypothetical protein
VAAGFAARILDYGHRRLDRSGWRIVRLSNFTLRRRSRLPCPPPSDAIRAPRPSFARSSMIGLPSASSSFRFPTETFSPLPAALHSVGTSTQVPPGVETLFLRQHPFARRRIDRGCTGFSHSAP